MPSQARCTRNWWDRPVIGSSSNSDNGISPAEDGDSNRHRVVAGRPRIGSTRDRGGRSGSGASGRCTMPSLRGGPPCTIASYRFRTARASNARPRAALAWIDRAITSRPDVSRSSRCTASTGPNPSCRCNATEGGSSGVRAGTLGMPAGLSTTIRSASANRISIPQPIPSCTASRTADVASRPADAGPGA